MTQLSARHQNVGRSAPRPFAVHPSATTRTRKVRRIGETVTPRDRDAIALSRTILANVTREQADQTFGMLAVRERTLERIAAKVRDVDALVIARRALRAAHGPSTHGPFALSQATLDRIDDTRGYCIVGRK